jgi:predicted phosphoribosyltransferase
VNEHLAAYGRFADRSDAGQRLAQRLGKYARQSDAIVLGLPRGGVPVAYEVARALELSLDVIVARKLGVPGYKEMAMGAIAGDVHVLNTDVILELGITQDEIEAIAAAEKEEMMRREQLFRAGCPALALRDRVVILVDDGIATGSTMRAAIAAVRAVLPRRVVVASPVIGNATFNELRHDADEVVSVLTSDLLMSIGGWYEDFSQVTEGEVRALLNRAEREWMTALNRQNHAEAHG